MNDLKQRLRKSVPARLRPYLGGMRRKLVANPLRIQLQLKRLLRDSSLSSEQRELVRQTNTQIHHRDGMYAGNAQDYFKAGLSAIECIDEVLKNFQPPAVNQILDLPSGYGRELRFLVRKFPQATFTACDIQENAVDFCGRTFGALGAYSKPEIRNLRFAKRFDLIWCGSLVTHLDSTAITQLLDVFADNLEQDGVAIVTTNGDFVADQMKRGATYDLPAEAIPALINAFENEGYAYRDYTRGLGYFQFHPSGSGYGVSLTSASWFRHHAGRVDGLEEFFFKPRGWANHQDVFGFRQLGKRANSSRCATN